jgi:translation initiation factor IF-3
MHYGQNKKDKRTNKENTTEKTKNRVTRTSLKSGDVNVSFNQGSQYLNVSFNQGSQYLNVSFH